MDVRLSPEQRALRDAAVQLVGRLGPSSVGALDDAERTAKLDAALAATGWRELRVADEGDGPLASGVEVAIVAEELGRGLVDAPFLGPTLAAELRRRAGAPAAAEAETVALTADLSALADTAARSGCGGRGRGDFGPRPDRRRPRHRGARPGRRRRPDPPVGRPRRPGDGGRRGDPR